jgi:hypothetical protein
MQGCKGVDSRAHNGHIVNVSENRHLGEAILELLEERVKAEAEKEGTQGVTLTDPSAAGSEEAPVVGEERRLRAIRPAEEAVQVGGVLEYGSSDCASSDRVEGVLEVHRLHHKGIFEVVFTAQHELLSNGARVSHCFGAALHPNAILKW